MSNGNSISAEQLQQEVYNLTNRVQELEDLVVMQKKTENALKDSEEKYRSLMENLPGTVARVNNEGKFIFVNKHFLHLTGLAAEDIVGHGPEAFERFIEPESYRRMVAGVGRSMIERIKVETEICTIDAQGLEHCLLQTAYPWYNKNGEPGGIEILSHDITARKKAEQELTRYHEQLETLVEQRTKDLKNTNLLLQKEIVERERVEKALRQSEQRYRLLFNNTSDPVLVHTIGKNGKPGNFIEANEKACSVSGYTREELLQLSPLAIDASENKPSLLSLLLKAKKGKSVYAERMCIAKDGTRIPVEISAHVFTLDGIPTAIIICRDITDRLVVGKALRESEEKFRTLAEKSPNMIFINKRGKVVYANDKCEEILGYTKKEFWAPDFNFYTVIAPEYHDLITENFRQHTRGIDIAPNEYDLLTKSGQRINALITTKLISYQGVSSILGIVTDITEFRRLEKDLAELEIRQRMEIGHDLHDGLGQYLTGISLKCKAIEQRYAEKKKINKKDITEIVDLINQATQKAHALSEGLAPNSLSVGGIETALHELAHQTRSLFETQCEFHGPTRSLKINQVTATHLYRIAQEAVTNAVRHGKPGRINISLEKNRQNIIMTIQDNGIGIDHKNQQGDGMGLRIMHYRARTIGAILEIKSAPKKGTLVRCTLHKKQTAAEN